MKYETETLILSKWGILHKNIYPQNKTVDFTIPNIIGIGWYNIIMNITITIIMIYM